MIFHKKINEPNLDEEFNSDSKSPRPQQEYKKFCIPMPETSKDPQTLQGVEKRIYNEKLKFQELDKIDPQTDKNYCAKFLHGFKWKDSVRSKTQKRQFQELLIEFSEIFGIHGFDVGNNSEIAMTLTLEHDQPVNTRSAPTPIHFFEELQVELALLQKQLVAKFMLIAKLRENSEF